LKQLLENAKGERIELEVEKARGFPIGVIRQWKDGTWGIKTPHGWEYVKGPHDPKIQEHLKAMNLDKPVGIVPSEGKPQMAAIEEKPKPKKEKAPKPPKLNREEKEEKALEDKIINNRDEFNKELGHKINAKHPHPFMDSAKIIDRLNQMGMGELKENAKKYGVKVEVAKPAGWEDKDWEQRIRADKDEFIDEILQQRLGGVKDSVWERKRREYKQLNAAGLVHRAKMFIMNDEVADKRKIKEENLKYEKEVTPKEDFYKAGSEERLAKGTPTDKEKLGGGHINEAVVINLGTPSGGKHKAVWKARNGEHEGVARGEGNIPEKAQWKRERAAYVVNAIVGLDNSPPVVIRNVEGEGVGAMMDFIPDAKTWDDGGAVYEDFPKSEWQKLALHSWLICNTDMHAGNFMYNKKEKKLFAIDNGLAFPERNQFGEFIGYRCKPHRFLQLHNHLDLEPDILKLVTPGKKVRVMQELERLGFPQKTVDIVAWRFDYILKHKALPEYLGDDFCKNIPGGP
jgi:hypothetical protein